MNVQCQSVSGYNVVLGIVLLSPDAVKLSCPQLSTITIDVAARVPAQRSITARGQLLVTIWNRLNGGPVSLD